MFLSVRTSNGVCSSTTMSLNRAVAPELGIKRLIVVVVLVAVNVSVTATAEPELRLVRVVSTVKPVPPPA